MPKVFLAFALLALAAGLPACTHDCTEIGCQDQLSGLIQTADGAWSDGDYVITIRADETSYECSMKLPEDLPDNGVLDPLPCTPQVGYSGVWLQQETECMETVDGDSVSNSCTPIPGKYILRFSLEGTPQSVAIQVERDGAVLAKEDFTPAYKTHQPNGKGCEPICRWAEVLVQLP